MRIIFDAKNPTKATLSHSEHPMGRAFLRGCLHAPLEMLLLIISLQPKCVKIISSLCLVTPIAIPLYCVGIFRSSYSFFNSIYHITNVNKGSLTRRILSIVKPLSDMTANSSLGWGSLCFALTGVVCPYIFLIGTAAILSHALFAGARTFIDWKKTRHIEILNEIPLHQDPTTKAALQTYSRQKIVTLVHRLFTAIFATLVLIGMICFTGSLFANPYILTAVAGSFIVTQIIFSLVRCNLKTKSNDLVEQIPPISIGMPVTEIEQYVLNLTKDIRNSHDSST